MELGSRITTLNTLGKGTVLSREHLSEVWKNEKANHANIEERASRTKGSESEKALNVHISLYSHFNPSL
jgi:hypothetical protein